MSCAAHDLAVSRRFLDWADVDLIREIVGKLADRPEINVVDLGVGSGTTAGAVFAERPAGLRVTSFDKDETNLHWSGVFITNIGHWQQWSGLLMDSVDGSQAFQDETVDLLMLDTSHEYEPTVRELAAWLPKVKPDGWIWCHDFRGGYPGVTRAIDEAIERAEIATYKVEGLGWSGKRLIQARFA